MERERQRGRETERDACGGERHRKGWRNRARDKEREKEIWGERDGRDRLYMNR